MSYSILITAAPEDSEEILTLLDDVTVLHTPLEIYKPKSKESKISKILDRLHDFQNIVYSSKRNATFFLHQVEKYGTMDEVKERLNLAVDEATFRYLESNGVPAIHPQNGSKPIDVVELMLRLQRLTATLYPCGSHRREDFPGFLEELDIAVTELDVFELEGPETHELETYRQQVEEKQPDTIIFHSRRSVNRTTAAFPDLDYENTRIISADKGITNKLQENDIVVDKEAKGSWESVAELL